MVLRLKMKRTRLLQRTKVNKDISIQICMHAEQHLWAEVADRDPEHFKVASFSSYVCATCERRQSVEACP